MAEDVVLKARWKYDKTALDEMKRDVDEAKEKVNVATAEMSAGHEQLGESVDATKEKVNTATRSMDMSYARLGTSISMLATAGMMLEGVWDRVAKGQMGMTEAIIRSIPAVISLAAALWTIVTAEKARAVASAIAHGISTLGAALPLIAAAAIAGSAIALAATAAIPSRQFGGPVRETGVYQLHAGEYVLPTEPRELKETISERERELKETVSKMEIYRSHTREHVLPRSPTSIYIDIHDVAIAGDYDVDRLTTRIVDRLKLSGVAV